jgi:hypothetical protein
MPRPIAVHPRLDSPGFDLQVLVGGRTGDPLREAQGSSPEGGSERCREAAPSIRPGARSSPEEARHRVRTEAVHSLRRGSLVGGEVVRTIPAVDRALPRGGLERGSLVDLHAAPGAGAFALALRLAAALQQSAGPQGVVVVVDPTGEVYPPALVQAGLDLPRVLLAIPPPADVAGCLDEALRSRTVAAALARVEGLDGRTSHRLRHAVRCGGGVGLLVRPPGEVGRISGAAVRLLVRGTVDALEVEPIRLRGGATAPWRVER